MSVLLFILYALATASIITGTVFLVLAKWTLWIIPVMGAALALQWLAFATATASVQSQRTSSRTCFNSTFWVWTTNIVAGVGSAVLSFLLLACLVMCKTNWTFDFEPIQIRKFYQACTTKQLYGTGLAGAALGLLVLINVFMLIWQLCHRCCGARRAAVLPVYVHKGVADVKTAPVQVPVSASSAPVPQQFVVS